MKPYKFEPYLKQTIWGGDIIAQYKGIANAPDHVGESWEVASIPQHDSIASEGGDGADSGLTLSQLIEKHGTALMGQRPFMRFGNNFPLIAKFLDTHEAISIQVHPGERLARERHNSPGKDEMWYVISAAADAEILCGLRKQITPDEFVHIMQQPARPDNTHPFQDIVDSYASHADDVFFLPSGRVHALGAGNLVAEIQQASDITYRVFDFCRKDKNGNGRELHIDLAKDAIDYYGSNVNSLIDYDHEAPLAHLIDCNGFQSYRIVVDGPRQIDFHCDSFVLVMCLHGRGTLNGSSIRQGETLLVPACGNVLQMDGQVTLLAAHI